MPNTAVEKPTSVVANETPHALPMSGEVREGAFPRRGAELSVIVPTFNERANVLELVQLLRESLADYR